MVIEERSGEQNGGDEESRERIRRGVELICARRRRFYITFFVMTVLFLLCTPWESLQLPAMGLWAVTLVATSCRWGWSRCPRCGNYIYTPADLRGYTNPFSKNCVNCGLPLRVNRE